jgi:tetratricopeptide (TPR) repeat protein
MKKENLLEILKSIESEIKDFTFNGKMTDIIKFYDELQNKFEYDISQFLITQKKSEIYVGSEAVNDDGINSKSFGVFYVFKVIGIDYEYYDFLFNDELSIDDKSYDDKENRIDVIYNGRKEFSYNSYETADILMSKIIDRIEKGKNIEEFFNYIQKNCYPNIGGYVAVENAYLIGSLYCEKSEIKVSAKFFEQMKKVKTISEITISEFYKKAANLYFERGYKAEALKMIESGLVLNPKLSVKKMKKNIETELE